jgi:hypothetical protein
MWMTSDASPGRTCIEFGGLGCELWSVGLKLVWGESDPTVIHLRVRGDGKSQDVDIIIIAISGYTQDIWWKMEGRDDLAHHRSFQPSPQAVGRKTRSELSLLLLPQRLLTPIPHHTVMLRRPQPCIIIYSVQSTLNARRLSLYCHLRITLHNPLAHFRRQLLQTRHDILCALPRLDTKQIHSVNLLEGAALPLNDEEVDDEATEDVGSRKDVAVAEVNGASDEGGEESEEEVPEPIRCLQKSLAQTKSRVMK